MENMLLELCFESDDTQNAHDVTKISESSNNSDKCTASKMGHAHNIFFIHILLFLVSFIPSIYMVIFFATPVKSI